MKEEDVGSNEWDYVVDRIEEARSDAQVRGDAEAEEDAGLLLLRVKDHEPETRPVVLATDRPKCAACGNVWPCPTLTYEARRWRDRDDFPKHLL